MQDIKMKAPKEQQQIVMKAYMNAYKVLGITDTQAAKLIGVARSTLLRKSAFEKDSKQNELQILFIRLYRSLFALFGGDVTSMKHWFEHKNTHIRGIPRELCFTVTGLVNINAYLDALRGKA
ncbi:MbcA/ParS/Xre antitoxin family protein [Paraglaciecola arctica]|uniref:MbcA/ParS/Xre antitoxin family protein n=1 Tax=Paraglaciecola arctica TaxID=1128911 RepID=UPI001C069C76|nr:MbcA/ParS/Xre antitoxin family protein [Paraglaciecola arctica]MBU3003562.1 MbcA/ParS/Xre antitoxin family protein [Paraglaciecola arctica]